VSGTLQSCVLAACALLLAASPAMATTLARMKLDELATAAQAIVYARCLETESRWEGGEIWTFTRFEVLEAMKGALPRLVTVRLLGGRVGHVLSTVEGVPRFQPDEETILFLERAPAGDFSVTSWAQGTFRIERNPHTGRQSVTQDSSAMAVFNPATRRFEHAGIRNLPLRAFKQRLAAILEQQGGRQP